MPCSTKITQTNNERCKSGGDHAIQKGVSEIWNMGSRVTARETLLQPGSCKTGLHNQEVRTVAFDVCVVLAV